MASLSEHATVIRAAIKAARDDGFDFELDESVEDFEIKTLDLVYRNKATHIVQWYEVYREDDGELDNG